MKKNNEHNIYENGNNIAYITYEPHEDDENKEKERDSIIHISDDDNINYKEIKIYKNIKNLLKILNLMN